MYVVDLLQVKAIYTVLNDTCRDLTYVTTNFQAWRKEAYFGRLRPSFSQVKKAILQRSDFRRHSSPPKAMLLGCSMRSRPAPGTPLVEHGPWSFTTMVVRPSAAPARRPPIAAHTRESRGRVFLRLSLFLSQWATRGMEGQALS
ncbi:hypothetical protein E2C01_060883 [Portunus trituberculatus]|uniref:Uncharacterized protein n=1 Tax=Portunus trituberculatus TaxID=210409 RepID=A0A5B7H2D8_PORTR|nr:hypothetical protein [Portunus trituberculatus]